MEKYQENTGKFNLFNLLMIQQKGGNFMKRMVLIIALGMFLAGCAGIKQSEYLEHSSHYKTWSHLGFSWWGFKNVTDKAADTSAKEKWWGISYARH